QKWRKFWGILYRESSCSTARLELFEGSAPPTAEKLRKGEGSKRLVKLSDCVHVAEASGDAGCPKETIPFLLETTDKRYLLAADGSEVASWIQKLCELAFPRSREEQGAGKDGQQSSLGSDGEFSMEENSLYSSRGKGRQREVGKVQWSWVCLHRRQRMSRSISSPPLPEAPRLLWHRGAAPAVATCKRCGGKSLPEIASLIREAKGQAGKQPPPRPTAAKPDHIYDEPEGLSPHTVYDEPEEVKGEAWRLQAAPEEPAGHEYPYNPQRDDYAVPKRPVPLRQPFLLQGKEWLGDTEYDNVALKFAKK
ncbi:DOK2 protein, partial [Corythaeola cristata]|nr:DOK2 protein [Corythaeola cristata]